MTCELILALDAASPQPVLGMLEKLRGTVSWIKVGLEMYTSCGPSCVHELAGAGFNIFLDLKLHDIPNTVAQAVTSAATLPVKMLTIHTSGGAEMMRRAVAAQQKAAPELRLLGVTVLTSMGAKDLAEVGVNATPEAQVLQLARLAVASGLRGLVCSPLELPALRKALPADVALITPGIRPTGSKLNDQSRVMTPGEAAACGANFVVVGRPIFDAPDPVAAAQAILRELNP